MSDAMLDGVLDVVSTEEPALHDKVAPVKTETKTESPKTETKTETKTNTKEVEASESDDEVLPDEQDFSRPSEEPKTEKEETTTEPSKVETETETNPEAETVEEDWKPNLPEPPKFNLPEPIVNDEGYITNMTPQEYQTFIVEKAKHEMRMEGYTQTFESQALDAAEKVLPEIKTSPAIRTMVENTRVASILTGQQINSYEAAKLVKEALGLTSTKIAEAKAAGAQNAKTSITIQKNAAVETTGSTKTKPSNPKNDNLSKRLKQGEDSAFAELFDNWDKDGKL